MKKIDALCKREQTEVNVPVEHEAERMLGENKMLLTYNTVKPVVLFEKPHAFSAVTLTQIEYHKTINGERHLIIVPKGVEIYVDVVAMIALIGDDHVDIESHEYRIPSLPKRLSLNN